MAYYSKKKATNIKLAKLIINEYQMTKSISEIAKKLNTNKVVVQRILITEGLWSSRRTRQVAELRNQGFSVKEMAAKLGIDERTILTYLPYKYGKYGQTGLNSHVLAHSETIDISKVPEADANESSVDALPGSGSVFRLKLELVDRFSHAENCDLGMDPMKKKEFLRLAEAREGIIREVLVPGEMNLHAFHYLIQCIFGWLNGHPHNFSLSESEFYSLTRGKVGGWENLCGNLLHFPSDEDSDLYWDDDYKSGQNVKTWYKRKYTGPYVQKALCETYCVTRIEVKRFFAKFSYITSDMMLDEMNRLVVLEEPLNFLNERLTLNELLIKQVSDNEYERRNEFRSWLEDLRQKKIKSDILIDGLSRSEWIELNDAIDGLKRWRSNLVHVEQMVSLDREDELIELTGSSAAEWISECKSNIPKLERKCKKLFDDYNPKLNPLFDTLYYDYVNDWRVKITVIDKYNTSSPVRENGTVSREFIDQVSSKLSPRCIAVDGLNVLDDVGGIEGFHRFLAALSGDETDEKERLKSWAQQMGWQALIEKPEDVLTTCINF